MKVKVTRFRDGWLLLSEEVGLGQTQQRYFDLPDYLPRLKIRKLERERDDDCEFGGLTAENFKSHESSFNEDCNEIIDNRLITV